MGCTLGSGKDRVGQDLVGEVREVRVGLVGSEVEAQVDCFLPHPK